MPHSLASVGLSPVCVCVVSVCVVSVCVVSVVSVCVCVCIMLVCVGGRGCWVCIAHKMSMSAGEVQGRVTRLVVPTVNKIFVPFEEEHLWASRRQNDTVGSLAAVTMSHLGSLIPRPSHHPVFDRLHSVFAYCKRSKLDGGNLRPGNEAII